MRSPKTMDPLHLATLQEILILFAFYLLQKEAEIEEIQLSNAHWRSYFETEQ